VSRARLKDKIAIVTGGGRGLGRAIALAFADEGATVVVAGRVKDVLDDVVHAIEARGGAASGLVADVTDEASVNALVDGTVRVHGRLDVLVNNAGVIVRKPALETTSAEWRRVIDVNLTGAWLGCVAAARHMVPAKSGKIINFGSTAGARGRAGMAAYCAAKAGVINLTRALAVEWADAGVYVNAISPGQFDTDMGAPVLATQAQRDAVLARVPLHRIGRPEEIGPLAVFLASSDSDMITGETIFIDAGVTAA